MHPSDDELLSLLCDDLERRIEQLAGSSHDEPMIEETFIICY